MLEENVFTLVMIHPLMRTKARDHSSPLPSFSVMKVSGSACALGTSAISTEAP